MKGAVAKALGAGVRVPRRLGARGRPGGNEKPVDPLDAQISDLLESVETEPPEPELETHAVDVVATPPELVRTPRRRRRRRRRNPIARQRLRYLIFALLLGIAAGLVCTRMLG